jgi:hypothetical protein
LKNKSTRATIDRAGRSFSESRAVALLLCGRLLHGSLLRGSLLCSGLLRDGGFLRGSFLRRTGTLRRADGVLQRLTRNEFENALRGHLNGLARLWVTRHARGAVANTELAERRQLDFVARLQDVRKLLEHRFHELVNANAR